MKHRPYINTETWKRLHALKIQYVRAKPDKSVIKNIERRALERVVSLFSNQLGRGEVARVTIKIGRKYVTVTYQDVANLQIGITKFKNPPPLIVRN